MKTGYNNLEQAYKDMAQEMVSYASNHLYNRDYAIDAMHEAFVKAAEYVDKHKKAKVSSFFLFATLKRAIRKINRSHPLEVNVGLMNQIDSEDNEIPDFDEGGEG